MNTLTDFLEQSQCQFRIYDLGRKVSEISNIAFNTFDFSYTSSVLTS